MGSRVSICVQLRDFDSFNLACATCLCFSFPALTGNNVTIIGGIVDDAVLASWPRPLSGVCPSSPWVVGWLLCVAFCMTLCRVYTSQMSRKDVPQPRGLIVGEGLNMWILWQSLGWGSSCTWMFDYFRDRSSFYLALAFNLMLISISSFQRPNLCWAHSKRREWYCSSYILSKTRSLPAVL